MKSTALISQSEVLAAINMREALAAVEDRLSWCARASSTF